MDYAERQEGIIKRLRPKAINHGQLDTDLIAIPPNFVLEIPPDRREAIATSLQTQGANFGIVIVRRTEAYETEEYEVVYGEDWCFVAKELGIERLWVWVFDLTNEQAVAVRQEMSALFAYSGVEKTPVVDNKPVSVVPVSVVPPAIVETPPEIKPVVLETEALKKLMEEFKETLENSLSEKLESTVKQMFSSLKDELLQAIGEQKKIEQPVIIDTPTKKEEPDYNSMTVPELKALAKKRGIPGISGMRKADLIKLLRRHLQ